VAIVKRFIAKNCSLVASLLVCWLLLCGTMPLIAIDMSMDLNMGDMAVSHGHHHNASVSEILGEQKSVGAVKHCCDALDDSVLITQNQLIDLFFDLSLIAVVCSFFFLWGMVTGRINTYYPFFIPSSGPPLHQRICVWLD